MRHRRARAPHALVALSGMMLALTSCSFEPALEDAVIVRAELRDITLGNVGFFVGGAVSGEATLLAEAEDGAVFEEAVDIEGGFLGPLFFVVGGSVPGPIPLDLTEAGGSLPGSELYGVYEGHTEQAAFLLGGARHTLQNAAGVELIFGYLAMGFGVFVAAEWLVITKPAVEPNDDVTMDDAGPADAG